MSKGKLPLAKLLVLVGLSSFLVAFVTNLPYSTTGLAVALLCFAAFAGVELASESEINKLTLRDAPRFLAYINNSIFSACVAMIFVRPKLGPAPNTMREFTQNLEMAGLFFLSYALTMSSIFIFGFLLLCTIDYRRIFSWRWAILNFPGMLVTIYTTACVAIETAS